MNYEIRKSEKSDLPRFNLNGEHRSGTYLCLFISYLTFSLATAIKDDKILHPDGKNVDSQKLCLG